MGPIESIAVIGECMVELRKADGQIEQGFGGDTLNTALYLSRLTASKGIKTSYVTGMGHDPFSRDMIAEWRGEKINTDMVYLSDTKLPGIYAIETAEDGERSFYYWRNDAAAKFWLRDKSPQEVAIDLAKHGLVYLTGISLAILPKDCREKLIESLQLCRKDGVKVAFDNNFRPALWNDIEEAKYWYSQILSITDMAFLTFDDEVMLWDDENENQAIERTKQFGVGEIIIKRGSVACIVVERGNEYLIATQAVNHVIDTTAAGDSFSAGYLAKRIIGGSCEDSAKSGHTLAGTVIQYRGAIIPHNAMPDL